VRIIQTQHQNRQNPFPSTSREPSLATHPRHPLHGRTRRPLLGRRAVRKSGNDFSPSRDRLKRPRRRRALATRRRPRHAPASWRDGPRFRRCRRQQRDRHLLATRRNALSSRLPNRRVGLALGRIRLGFDGRLWRRNATLPRPRRIHRQCRLRRTLANLRRRVYVAARPPAAARRIAAAGVARRRGQSLRCRRVHLRPFASP
jgi:hypothetical protein